MIVRIFFVYVSPLFFLAKTSFLNFELKWNVIVIGHLFGIELVTGHRSALEIVSAAIVLLLLFSKVSFLCRWGCMFSLLINFL